MGRCRVGHGLVSAAGGRKPLSRLLHPSRIRHRPFPSNSIRWASERPRRSSHHTMSTPRRGPRGSVGALIEEVRFARDSPVEGDGFEPSVPRQKDVCKHRDGRRSQAARAQIGGNWRKCRTPAELARSDEATGSIWCDRQWCGADADARCLDRWRSACRASNELTLIITD